MKNSGPCSGWSPFMPNKNSIQLSYGRASNASADIFGSHLGSARNTAERNLNGFG